jgi:hypothetical protein
MLGLSVESDYVEHRDDLRFNWRYTDGLEHGSARQWRERDGYRHRYELIAGCFIGDGVSASRY